MSQITDINHLLAQNLFNVNGLNILITGAGSGLGAYMARALAINGAFKIFILGRRPEALERTKSSLPSTHSNTIIPITCDVTSKSSLSTALQTITNTHSTSHLDILICNSGTTGPSINTSTFSSITELAANMLQPSEELLTNTYRVNLTSIHLTVGTFLPLLDASNHHPDRRASTPRPQIITTSSIAAFNRVPLNNLTYAASKAGVVHLTKQFSTLLAKHNIRANTIAPGLYMSEMTEGFFQSRGLGTDGSGSGTSGAHNVEGSLDGNIVPARRGGDEQDMAGVLLWLCSRAGAFVNGCVVVTDGGRLSVMPATY